MQKLFNNPTQVNAKTRGKTCENYANSLTQDSRKLRENSWEDRAKAMRKLCEDCSTPKRKLDKTNAKNIEKYAITMRKRKRKQYKY